jgi:hypothetical protein
MPPEGAAFLCVTTMRLTRMGYTKEGGTDGPAAAGRPSAISSRKKSDKLFGY